MNWMNLSIWIRSFCRTVSRMKTAPFRNASGMKPPARSTRLLRRSPSEMAYRPGRLT